jgi:hypothetical protein
LKGVETWLSKISFAERGKSLFKGVFVEMIRD